MYRVIQDDLEPGEFVCETCEGLGTIDERLSAYSDSNPEAVCPDCDGRGWWKPGSLWSKY